MISRRSIRERGSSHTPYVILSCRISSAPAFSRWTEFIPFSNQIFNKCSCITWAFADITCSFLLHGFFSVHNSPCPSSLGILGVVLLVWSVALSEIASWSASWAMSDMLPTQSICCRLSVVDLWATRFISKHIWKTKVRLYLEYFSLASSSSSRWHSKNKDLLSTKLRGVWFFAFSTKYLTESVCYLLHSIPNSIILCFAN